MGKWTFDPANIQFDAVAKSYNGLGVPLKGNDFKIADEAMGYADQLALHLKNAGIAVTNASVDRTFGKKEGGVQLPDHPIRASVVLEVPTAQMEQAVNVIKELKGAPKQKVEDKSFQLGA